MPKLYDMTKHLPKKGLGQPMQQQINIDLSKTTPQICHLCGCPVFIPGIQLHKVSALMSPTGQELLAQSQIFLCANCKAPYGSKEGVKTND